MHKHKFLVTGCAGFIGGHMLDRLIREGHEVVGVDDFSTGSPANMEASRGKFEFIEGSLCDTGVAARAMAGVNRVVHLAAIPSVPRSLENPLACADSAVMGTVSLLEAAAREGVERVVQASSSSVYGDHDHERNVETMFPNPLSPYAVSKLAQEHFARVFCLCRDLDTVSLRYFNVFGPRQDPNSKYAAVIPKFITDMLAGRRPTVYGDGKQIRTFTYIDNVVEANLLAALHPEPLRGEIVNVAGDSGESVNDLVGEINRLLDTDIVPHYVPPRVGEVLVSRADISKAKRLFGFVPTVGFAEGLARTLAYLREREAA